MNSDWDISAAAWIALQGDHGDWGRRCVLDPLFLNRLRGRTFEQGLDIGCGEGRSCRLIKDCCTKRVGVDPTLRLVHEASLRDPQAIYLAARSENLPFQNNSFDLVVCYLSLMNMENLFAATSEMYRVMSTGGILMLAILSGFHTSGAAIGWVSDSNGSPSHYPIDQYLDSRPVKVKFSGVEVVNWHRPLATYVRQFLESGFHLRYFDEPEPAEKGTALANLYRRAPRYVYMEWEKRPILTD